MSKHRQPTVYPKVNGAHSTLSSVLEVARQSAPATQLELPLGIDYAPRIVREHGLKDAHLWPQVARRKGESFRVHARNAWSYPSLELRAGNSWPAVTLDCDVPSAVVDALYSNHHGGSGPALPAPNMVVQRRSNSHSHVSWFLERPVHRGESARAAPLRKLARITEFYRDALDADSGYAGCLTHNPLEESHRAGEFSNPLGPQLRLHACRTFRGYPERLALADRAEHRDGPELCAVWFPAEVGRIAFQPRA